VGAGGKEGDIIMTSTSVVKTDDGSNALENLIEVAAMIETQTGKAPRIVVLGKKEIRAIEETLEMNGKQIEQQSEGRIFGYVDGIEIIPLDVDTYFRAVTVNEWEVLMVKVRCMGFGFGDGMIKAYLLAECFIDYCNRRNKETMEERANEKQS